MGFCVAAALWLFSRAAAADALEFVLTTGMHDIVDQEGDGPFEQGFTVRLTGTEVWRSKRNAWKIVPSFGSMATEENVHYEWVGGTLLLPLNHRWGLAPELGAGFYSRGQGKNLGGQLEFRSGIEATFRANDTIRLGAGFYHLSNAGIYNVNPGVNSLLFTFGWSPKPRWRMWDTAPPQ